MVESNGRIKLTWSQTAWGITVLVVLISGWFRIEYRLSQLEITVKEGIYSKTAIDQMKRDADRTHDELRQDINTLQGGKR